VFAGDSADAEAAGTAPIGTATQTSAATASAAATAAAHAAAALAGAANSAALNATLGPDKHAHDAESSDSAALAGVGVAPGAAGGDSAALSQLTAPATGSAAAAGPAPTLQVHANVESSGFSQGLTDRVSWMVNNGVNSAKLQVNPPQLGPIELNILVQGDHAQVSMTTHSAVTRAALESSSPQLRELLGAQGFAQVSVDISQRSFQDRSAYSPPYERVPASPSSAAGDAVSDALPAPVRQSTGVLDAYA
jgi:flagellar hook-length control protein FliK